MEILNNEVTFVVLAFNIEKETKMISYFQLGVLLVLHVRLDSFAFPLI